MQCWMSGPVVRHEWLLDGAHVYTTGKEVPQVVDGNILSPREDSLSRKGCTIQLTC